MDEDDRKKYKKLFLKTGRAYIKDMEKNIDAIHKNYHKNNAIENLFISVHSLRGQSLMMGYSNLGNYLDTLERTLHAKQEHLLGLDYKVMNAIESGIRKLKSLFDQLEINDTKD